MLNFLYKVSLKTRVKTTNGKVGRKYARNERGLQFIVIEHITLNPHLFIPFFTLSWRLTH